MASVHAHIHMQCHMQSITHGCNYLISITTCQQALYQLSAQSICNHIPHSIPLEGCLDQVLGWLYLPESKKNEMLPTFLNYEAVCASLLYIGSRGEKRSKSGYKNIWSKEQQWGISGRFPERDSWPWHCSCYRYNCMHIISKSWKVGYNVIVYKWILMLTLNSLFKGRLLRLYL